MRRYRDQLSKVRLLPLIDRSPTRHISGIAASLHDVSQPDGGEVPRATRPSTSIADSTRKLIGIKRSRRLPANELTAPCSVTGRQSTRHRGRLRAGHWTGRPTGPAGRPQLDQPVRPRDRPCPTVPSSPRVIDTSNQYRSVSTSPTQCAHEFEVLVPRMASV